MSSHWQSLQRLPHVGQLQTCFASDELHHVKAAMEWCAGYLLLVSFTIASGCTAIEALITTGMRDLFGSGSSILMCIYP